MAADPGSNLTDQELLTGLTKPPGNDEEAKVQWEAGLAQALQAKQSDLPVSVEQIVETISEYRRRNAGDPTKIVGI